MSPAAQTLDDLAVAHGAVMPPGGDALDALAQTHGSIPVFRQSDQSPNDVDPNTFPTYVKHLWGGVNPVSFGQMLPFPKTLGGSGTDNPLNPKKIVDDLYAVKKDADARLKKGDYVGAFAKYVESVVPIFGPMLSHQGDEWQQGKYAAALGDATALTANVAAGKAGTDALTARYPLASHPVAAASPVAPAVVDFAQARKIPLDAATVSDNLAVKGTQAIADRSFAGSLVATPANEARAAAMTRVGSELADETHPSSFTPEQAGNELEIALSQKRDMHVRQANNAYNMLRLHEGPETAVNMAPVKRMLQPIYEQMTRQMPITQQQANPGLKALQNILDAPDFAPLSQVDQDLGALKSIAREHGGLAKAAVSRLSAAVEQAAKAGEPEVWRALQQGREATKAKYAVADVLDGLHDEPVRTIKALTAPKDSAVQSLRGIARQVPETAPIIARAYLEDLLEKPQAVTEWRKLGAETKAILFPRAGHAQALDHFFALTDRISKTNVNPSGSGYVAALGAQGAMVWTNPWTAAAVQIAGATLSKLLRSQTAVNALTRGLQLSSAAPVAVRAAATANLVKAASSAGVVLDFPKAADQGQK